MVKDTPPEKIYLYVCRMKNISNIDLLVTSGESSLRPRTPKMSRKILLWCPQKFYPFHFAYHEKFYTHSILRRTKKKTSYCGPSFATLTFSRIRLFSLSGPWLWLRLFSIIRPPLSNFINARQILLVHAHL